MDNGDVDKYSDDSIGNDYAFDDGADWDSLYENFRDRDLENLYDGPNDVDLIEEGVKETNLRPKGWKSDMAIPMFKMVNDFYYLDSETNVFRNWDNFEDTIEYNKGMEEVYCEELTHKLNKKRDAFQSRRDSGKRVEPGKRVESEKEIFERQARDYFNWERFA